MTTDGAGMAVGGSWSARLVERAAWLLIAGGVVTVALGLVDAQNFTSAPLRTLSFAGNIAYPLILGAGFFGLGRSGALGEGRLCSAGTGLTVAGLLIFVPAEVLAIASGDDSPLVATAYSAALLAVALGGILAGIACIRARRWSGWRRYSVVAIGAGVLVLIGPTFALPGKSFEYGIAAWGLTFIAAGVGAFREQRAGRIKGREAGR